MNEAQWLFEGYATDMISDLIAGRLPIDVSPRKFRLYAAACWRLYFSRKGHLDQPQISLAEHDADGRYCVRDSKELDIKYSVLATVAPDAAEAAALQTSSEVFLSERCSILRDVVGNPFRQWTNTGKSISQRIAGRREGPGMFVDTYQTHNIITPTALSIANAAYDERREDSALDQEILLVLSDALEENGLPPQRKCFSCFPVNPPDRRCPGCSGSGVEQHPILASLRNPSLRWRGFWVIDLLLAKE